MPKGKGYGPDSREGKRQAFMKEMTARTTTPVKKKPVSRRKKLKRTIKELIGGSKTYLPEKKKKKKKKTKTIRTEAVYTGMEAAGVDYEKDKPSARLRRKNRD